MIRSQRILDEVFGTIEWHLEPGRLLLGGDEVPQLELVRRGSEPPLLHVPIGSRRAEQLTMSLEGRQVALRPGKGRMSRRSYRVEVRTAAGALLFTPSSPTTARLVRGTRYRGDNELGVFERSADDGTVTGAWSGAVTALGVTTPAPTPLPEEAAIGYALAVGFGTGAQLFVPALVSSIGQLIPG